MSRSKHTRPRSVLAADRLLRPRESKGHDDPAKQRRAGRRLKRAGLVPAARQEQVSGKSEWSLPRVTERKAREGYFHPASRNDVMKFLRSLGAECLYGIRVIELRRGPQDGSFALGRLFTPGRLVLYDQPRPPWRIPAQLPTSQVESLEEAGAQVEELEGSCLVHWPGQTLPEFMLWRVLLHEMGHHVLQHHKGKRRARVVRTRDHESNAELFARRWRTLCLRCHE